MVDGVADTVVYLWQWQWCYRKAGTECDTKLLSGTSEPFMTAMI